MKIVAAIVCLMLIPGMSISVNDPAVTDSDKYKVILENERVRVLDYRDKPGDKTTMHHHPDFVIYALSGFQRKLTISGGKQIIKSFKAGDVAWMKEQFHVGENIGTTDTHVLIVEIKGKQNVK